MSEIRRFTSASVKGWLEAETKSIFVPVHTKAQKLLGEMRKTLENLTETSKMLLDNSTKEIERRNMKTYGRARAMNKLARVFVDRMKQLKTPDQVSYDSVREFVQETQEAFAVTDIDIRNYFPRISPFFILDRRKFLAVFERAKDSLKELSDFVAKEYVKTKTLEETFQLIDRLQSFEQQLTRLNAQKKKIEDESASVRGEIADMQKRMADVRNRGGITQLDQLDAEIGALTVEVKHSLQHLQKPFVKLQSLTLHGGGSGLTPEETSKLSKYLENPLQALANEEAGYPILKQILQKLSRAISDGKLKLKPEKVRKAEQAIENILNKNSLASLQKKCVEATTRKKQLSTSKEITDTQDGLQQLRQLLENLNVKREHTESEMSTVERAQNEAKEKIHAAKDQIEKNIFSFMGTKVEVA